MADTFDIEIATPEKLVLHRSAESAQIPGKDGYMGILPGHAALLSELGAGTLSITGAGTTENFTVTGGYVEVRDDHVRVLADSVEQGPGGV
jgi:F-type H+-transporting ATPase subunit epsilon